MKDPNKIWEEVNALKKQRYEWKMGLNHKDCNREEFIAKMETTYSYLKESSNTIFKNLIEEDDFDMKKLKYMVDMMKSMKSKEKTFESASKEVGEKFAEEYIKPLVEKLDKEKAKKAENEDNKIEEVD